MIRTKIVVTLGPACATQEVIARLFEEGADVCRLNFSHGDLAEHLRMLKAARAAAAHWGESIAFLGDLGGPKIRLGQVADERDGGMAIKVGDMLHIQRQPIVGAKDRVSTNWPGFVDDVAVGDRVLIEDGLLRFVTVEKTADEIVCACTAGGILRSAKGINLPNTRVSLPSITDRDWKCVDWAIENDLDYLALSFVRRADELLQLRDHLRKRKSGIHLIAKIEKPDALQHIDAITEASDGLMVARGDLGVEMDVAQVPIIQKDLVRRCQRAGKPVIVATQMLQSMIDQATPTRAEVSDVANAIFDGTDAVMLSGETSVGKYPAAAVHMMNRIAQVTEEYTDRGAAPAEPVLRTPPVQYISAMAHGVWQIVRDLKIGLVALRSQDGAAACAFSRYRFPVPIVAFSDDPCVLRQMTLHYGVIPRHMAPPRDLDSMIGTIDELIQRDQLAAAGEQLVIVAGGTAGGVGGIIIHTLGEPHLPLRAIGSEKKSEKP